MYSMLLFLGGIVYHLRSDQWLQFHMAIILWRKSKMMHAKCQCNHKTGILFFISIHFKFFDKCGGRPITTLNSGIWPDFIKLLLLMSGKEEADGMMSIANLRNWAYLYSFPVEVYGGRSLKLKFTGK